MRGVVAGLGLELDVELAAAFALGGAIDFYLGTGDAVGGQAGADGAEG